MKTWEKPKLIVLARNNPQEAVLSYCKGTTSLLAVIYPASDFTSCVGYPSLAMLNGCLDCQSVNVS